MFCMILSGFLLFFVYFVPLVMAIVVLASKSLFRPANGVPSTCSLAEIHIRGGLNVHYLSSGSCVPANNTFYCIHIPETDIKIAQH